MGTLLKQLTNFNADILGITMLLAEGNDISGNGPKIPEIGSSSFRLPHVRPMRSVKKSPIRLVTENAYETVYQTLEKVAEQARNDLEQ
jgi:hypothetical protein